VRAGALEAWLADPAGMPHPQGLGLAMIDPMSRRRNWLRPTVLDGRRRPPRYEDYSDFMRRLARRRPR
jgi:hypothetical protein